MPEQQRKLFAILIDADNIPAKHAEAVLKEVTTFGEPALRRVYGDWSSDQLKGWLAKSAELGLVAHQQSANTKGKNATDIGLVIDAMDILHTGRFEGFVLVSSDSDFTALANRIREQGLEVIGIGESKAPVSLRNVCNRFILIENIIDEPEPLVEGKSPVQPTKMPATKAVPLILSAMRAIAEDGEWLSLGVIGQHVNADNPDFDPRSYGSAKLSDLLEATGHFIVDRDAAPLRAKIKPQRA